VRRKRKEARRKKRRKKRRIVARIRTYRRRGVTMFALNIKNK